MKAGSYKSKGRAEARPYTEKAKRRQAAALQKCRAEARRYERLC